MTVSPKATACRLAAALLSLVTAACGASAPPAAPPPSTDYDELVALFREFRDAVTPKIVDGVPDHTDAAMTAEHRAVQAFARRLDAIDPSGWPIDRQADHLLVRAEMRAVDFHHRVLRPWRRDPSYYQTVSLSFGPKIAGAFAIPTFPLADDAVAPFQATLRAVPRIFDQARAHLTEVPRDLALIGVRQKRIEVNVYRRIVEGVAEHHPALRPDAERARDAAEGFLGWLEDVAGRASGASGLGKDDYNWYVRYVLLVPYTWDEMRLIGEREYERAMMRLKIEEHRNRREPMTEPAATLEEFERRREEADAALVAFLRDERILTVPDDLVPRRNEGPYVLPADRDPTSPGPFDPPIRRHFFRQTEDREPLPLRAHNVPGHLLDTLMRRRDDRPIRGTSRLSHIDGGRLEGWAYYLEELIEQGGLLADRPKAREVNYILMAKRAARILPEIMMHSHDWTFDEAVESMTSRTPYWMDPDDPIALYDLELYLRQPGLGIGYPIGKVQFEQLMTDHARQLGPDFDLTAFHDEFLAAGLIPISLIRWQMTGMDDQVRFMR